MNNEEFLRNQQRINEQTVRQGEQIKSEHALHEANNILDMNQTTNTSIKNTIQKTMSVIESEQNLKEKALTEHMQKGMVFSNTAYPYHIKNEIYKKTLEAVLALLPEEDRKKYHMLFQEKYEERIKDNVSYIQIYNKEKKTSNFI